MNISKIDLPSLTKHTDHRYWNKYQDERTPPFDFVTEDRNGDR